MATDPSSLWVVDSAATVNWVTQTAFVPPLLVIGVKTDSGAYKIIQVAKRRTTLGPIRESI